MLVKLEIWDPKYVNVFAILGGGPPFLEWIPPFKISGSTTEKYPSLFQNKWINESSLTSSALHRDKMYTPFKSGSQLSSKFQKQKSITFPWKKCTTSCWKSSKNTPIGYKWNWPTILSRYIQYILYNRLYTCSVWCSSSDLYKIQQSLSDDNTPVS
jgi:hypothetical protein